MVSLQSFRTKPYTVNLGCQFNTKKKVVLKNWVKNDTTFWCYFNTTINGADLTLNMVHINTG